jgi:hypothetical protein
MDLSTELIALLRRAMETDEYFNPWMLQTIIDAIYDYDNDAYRKIPDDIEKWVSNMISR